MIKCARTELFFGGVVLWTSGLLHRTVVMKIEIPWRAMACIGFVAAFVSIGGCVALTYKLDQVIDIQNQQLEIQAGIIAEIQTVDTTLTIVSHELSRYVNKGTPIDWELKEGLNGPYWVSGGGKR